MRNQAQTEAHNDPENKITELQQIHKPGQVSTTPQKDTSVTVQELDLNKTMILYSETSEPK